MSVVLTRHSEAAGPSGRPPGLPRGAPTPKDLRAAETRAARQLKAAIRSREAGEDVARLNEVTNEGKVLDAKANNAQRGLDRLRQKAADAFKRGPKPPEPPASLGGGSAGRAQNGGLRNGVMRQMPAMQKGVTVAAVAAGVAKLAMVAFQGLNPALA